MNVLQCHSLPSMQEKYMLIKYDLLEQFEGALGDKTGLWRLNYF